MLYHNVPLLHVFHAVVACGSFQGAAEQLKLPRSSVSKKVRQLEDLVGQPLLMRSTRQLHITDVGQDLVTQTQHLSDVLSNMGQVIEATQGQVRGSVKLSASVLMGQRFVLPLLHDLQSRFPEVVLDLNLDDDNVDLLANRVDIAIRVGHLPDSTLIARQLGQKKWGWFASPKYLAARGEPENPQALTLHNCLVFTNRRVTMNHWPFKDQHGDTHTVEVSGSVTTDNSRALVDMASAGLGIVMVDPLFIRHELQQGALVPILTQWQHPDTSPIHLLCLGQRSRAAQAVWQFLLERLDF